MDWIDRFIRFNGIRIVTKWASALNEAWRHNHLSGYNDSYPLRFFAFPPFEGVEQLLRGSALRL